MNPVFLSYQNSSQFFLGDIDNVLLEKWSDYFNSTFENYDYRKFVNCIVTSFKAKQGAFRFFEFPNTNTGFLAKVPDETTPEKISEVNKLHLELNEIFGVIIDSYSMNESKELSNYSSVFAINEDIFGLSDLESDYIKKCHEDNSSKNHHLLELITIANEFNGNLVQYDQNDKIYFYLPDHIKQEKYIKVDGAPPDTFYKLLDDILISDWVEHYFKQYLTS